MEHYCLWIIGGAAFVGTIIGGFIAAVVIGSAGPKF